METNRVRQQANTCGQQTVNSQQIVNMVNRRSTDGQQSADRRKEVNSRPTEDKYRGDRRGTGEGGCMVQKTKLILEARVLFLKSTWTSWEWKKVFSFHLKFYFFVEKNCCLWNKACVKRKYRHNPLGSLHSSVDWISKRRSCRSCARREGEYCLLSYLYDIPATQDTRGVLGMYKWSGMWASGKMEARE